MSGHAHRHYVLLRALNVLFFGFFFINFIADFVGDPWVDLLSESTGSPRIDASTTSTCLFVYRCPGGSGSP